VKKLKWVYRGSTLGFVSALCAAMILSGCARAPLQPNSSPSASASENLRRDPAASQLKIFDGADVQLLKDLFQFDTRGKQLKYVVRSKFWTSMDKPYLQKKAKEALEQAIAKTLAVTDAEGGLLGKFKQNLTQEFLKEFVYTLQVYKILNGTIQFDLYFLPEEDSVNDFSNEYSSNRLVRLSETGTLQQKLRDQENWTVTGQLGKASHKLIALSRLAGNQDRTLYAGGAISVYLKLADMRWDPLKPVPHPKKNAVKGFIRYRRYFIHDGSLVEGSCKTDRVSIGKLEWASGKKQSDQLMTVDLYKAFNLANMDPTSQTLEIFPGRWLASNQGRGGLLPRGFLGFKDHEWVGKNLKTGSVYISGTANSFGPPGNFEHELKSLVYSFENKRFDAARSSIYGEVSSDYPSATSSNIAMLLQDCDKYLIKALSLDRVMTPIHASTGGVQ